MLSQTVPESYPDIKEGDILGVLEQSIGVGHARRGGAGSIQVVVCTVAAHKGGGSVQVGPQVHSGHTVQGVCRDS